MLTSEILVAARALLTPETWGKGNDGECIMGALGLVAQEEIWSGAYPVLSVCALGHTGGPLFKWNDAPERTLADVHALFDAAIAIAHQQEQAVAVEVPA